MSKNRQFLRNCKDCPERTAAVCRYVFGKYWVDKSLNGEGCNYPLDEVAEAWYARGWMLNTDKTVTLTPPVRKTPKPAPSKAVRTVSPKKKSYVQLDLVQTAELPPLSDDDY